MTKIEERGTRNSLGARNGERWTENGKGERRMENVERGTGKWERGNGSLGPKLQRDLLMTMGSKGRILFEPGHKSN